MKGEDGLSQLPEVELQQAGHSVDLRAGEVNPLTFTADTVGNSTGDTLHRHTTHTRVCAHVIVYRVSSAAPHLCHTHPSDFEPVTSHLAADTVPLAPGLGDRHSK